MTFVVIKEMLFLITFWKGTLLSTLLANGTAGGEVEPRDGVLRLMDEARAAGLKLGVCSAATKSSVICVLTSLLGPERFQVRNATAFLAFIRSLVQSCRISRISSNKGYAGK